MNKDCMEDLSKLIFNAKNDKIDIEVFADYLENYDIMEIQRVCWYIERHNNVTLTYRLDKEFITITRQ